MTHFRTIVFVPKETYKAGVAEVEEYIAEQMAPYIETGTGACDRRFQVFEVEHEKKDIVSAAKKIVKDKYVQEDPKLKKLYEALLKEKKYLQILQEWGGGELDLHGNFGHYTNPNSFYDYYRIGGRWSGLITGKLEESDDGGFNFGREYEDLAKNSIPVKVLLKGFLKKEKELVPLHTSRDALAKAFEEGDLGYAIPFREFFKDQKSEVWSKLYEDIGKEISKRIREMNWGPFYNEFLISKIVAEGKVFEADDVGWWGSSTPKMTRDEWKKVYLKLLEEHKGDYAVSLDCHV